MIKTFRGLIADGAQDTITLHTNDGSTGYRITKFQLISNSPVNDDTESIVKIFKVKQTGAPTAQIDFSDNTLLAAGVWSNDAVTQTYTSFTSIIFDQEIFNQDIYVTHSDQQTGQACNYYIELEQMTLASDENTVATLKDIRNRGPAISS